MNDTDSRIAASLPRLRRLAHALVCEPDRADELVKELLEQTSGGGAPVAADDIEWVRRLRKLWFNRREEWQAALPLDATTEIARAMQAMAALPRNQREAVALVVIDGLDYRDAADVAGVSLVTLAERLVLARRALAALLAENPA